ncbi:MAG: DUF3127 domain-containing protein [Verrucomicrobia bacterium]|nr:DUF3127 domain-containing protein [Verrucomicrobiota bacterium]
MYEMTGTIEVLNATEQVNERFSKREFVVNDEDDRYPQVIKFELTQDRCELLDSYKVGDRVHVTFNIRGREWTSPQGEKRFFVSLNAWKLDAAGAAENDPGSDDEPPLPDHAPADLDADGADNLPF